MNDAPSGVSARAELAYSPQRLDAFVDRLNALCREFGLGIAGEPHLFVMEPDDRMFSYVADETARLVLR